VLDCQIVAKPNHPGNVGKKISKKARRTITLRIMYVKKPYQFVPADVPFFWNDNLLSLMDLTNIRCAPGE
jgi:hypothetical protein